MVEIKKNIGSTSYIGGLRGFAALMVVTNHMWRVFYPSMITGKISTVHLPYFELLYHSSPFMVITSGFYRVSIFFILSGYILSKNYCETNNGENLISSSIKRFPRLFIPVACSVILSYIFLRLSLYRTQELGLLTKSTWVLYQTPNPSFINFIKVILYKVMFFGDISYNISLWTINPELKGSIILFIVLGITHNMKRKPAIFFSVLCFFVLIHRYEFAAMFLGLLLNFKTGLRIDNLYLRWVCLLSIFSLGFCFGGFPVFGIIDNDPGFIGTVYERFQSPWAIIHGGIIIVFGAFLTIFTIMSSHRIKSFLAIKPLMWMGKHSVSIFVLHMIIVNSFSAYFFIVLSKYLTYNTAFLIIYILTVSLVFVISIFFTKYIDTPSVKFAKYIYERYFKQAVLDIRIKYSNKFPDSRFIKTKIDLVLLPVELKVNSATQLVKVRRNANILIE